MERYIFILLLIASCSYQRDVGSSSQYEGFQLLRVQVPKPGDLQPLLELEKPPDCEVDFWRKPGNGYGVAEIIVGPKRHSEVTSSLKRRKLTFTVVATNLSKIFERDAEARGRRRVFPCGEDPGKLGVEEFHDFEEIQCYLKSVAKKYSSKASLITLGRSTQNRPLTTIKIGNRKRTPKGAAFMNGCIHAREWLGCATMLYIIKQLTENSRSYQQLLDTLDIYILPVANPDGYVYSWDRDRKWRKTRSGPRNRCYGVDANRNFNFHWGEVGCSQDPCRETYCGPHAMSEPEVRAIADFMRQQSANMKVYFDVHTYSEYFAFSYAYALQFPPNYEQLKLVAESATTAINNTNNEHFQWGSIAQVLYPASGSSMDYMTGVLHLPLSFTMELRPTRDVVLGFIISPEEIVPGASEAWSGIYDVLKYIIRRQD